jgi:DNA polymerase elongation subunit (family B)
VDRDVTSYYPSLIINANICPPAYGQDFQAVYRSILDRRVQAKRAGNKVVDSALKIVLNGTFGKLGEMHSMMYAPDQLIAVTLSGQLALLMLIEALDMVGIEVASANTDGVVSLVPDEQRSIFEAVIAAWEMTTGLGTEETEYAKLYSKDVNNYLAWKLDGTLKAKGLYAPAGLQKNVTNAICVDAVVAFLGSGVPINDTVKGCTDIRKFLTIRQVNGGAVWNGQYLGKAVRWYYQRGNTTHIEYATNGNMVARSTGARPLMELPDALPADIDYDWYIREAESILSEVGG